MWKCESAGIARKTVVERGSDGVRGNEEE